MVAGTGDGKKGKGEWTGIAVFWEEGEINPDPPFLFVKIVEEFDRNLCEKGELSNTE